MIVRRMRLDPDGLDAGQPRDRVGPGPSGVDQHARPKSARRARSSTAQAPFSRPIRRDSRARDAPRRHDARSCAHIALQQRVRSSLSAVRSISPCSLPPGPVRSSGHSLAQAVARRAGRASRTARCPRRAGRARPSHRRGHGPAPASAERRAASLRKTPGWRASAHGPAGRRAHNGAASRFGPTNGSRSASSASRTITFACGASAAAADSPATPPPMTRMSLVWLTYGAAVSRSCTTLPPCVRRIAFDDLVIVGKHRRALLLVPEGG